MKFNEASPELRAYVECALWSSCDMDTIEPLDKDYSAEDISEEALDKMNADLEAFLKEYYKFLGAADIHCHASADQVAHDFWLTRNHHGAGFWDRPELYSGQTFADLLTTLAHSFGEADLLADDDGKLSHFPV